MLVARHRTSAFFSVPKLRLERHGASGISARFGYPAFAGANDEGHGASRGGLLANAFGSKGCYAMP
jgi:hypothetical protein